MLENVNVPVVNTLTMFENVNVPMVSTFTMFANVNNYVCGKHLHNVSKYETLLAKVKVYKFVLV